ncbi:shikimate dehydrogenase [Oleiagrimonas citrea]|uniref:Shikimate dehydrogenase (NADP(+)) n=1 Tax=Oleiagrimonas citrea TaxID=1665687 RepID=A0A846ZQU5_9GAMM|nr:shikimate dehydrogenase [Oleiagrimonas citrea]NKZ40047.1 shikimate dehydrogenase [Oleiagrimonas citrea]
MSETASRYAVFGHPVAHSLSPRIHQTFARQFGIALEYETIDVAPDDFANAVRDFFAGGGAGANVTVPHKHAALALADTHSEAAARSGAANVLTPQADGGLAAHNNDGAGMVRDLTERHRLDLRGHDTLLLGAGGAAQGVAWALLDAGVDTLTIVNRSAERAEALADRLGEPARAHARYWNDLASIGSFDLIVNATSAGVQGQALDLPFAIVGARALCYDLSYGQAATPFLSWARAAGARFALDGLGMLVETAADSFALWHGKRPDADPVYDALRADGV